MSKISDAWKQLGIIQRQRFEQATGMTPLRLTDDEREAVEAAYSRLTADTHYATVAATLRGLLDRTELRREIGSA